MLFEERNHGGDYTGTPWLRTRQCQAGSCRAKGSFP
jgi:hypothetical protein